MNPSTDRELVEFFRFNWPVPWFRFCGLYELDEEHFSEFVCGANLGIPNTDTRFDPVRAALIKFRAWRLRCA